MAVLQDLSSELIDAILLFTSPRQLLVISLCSRWFHNFLSRSSLAQYRIECWRTGVCEDLVPQPSYPEMTTSIRRREEAWHTLDVQKRVELRIPNLLPDVYDFKGGILALTDASHHPRMCATLKMPTLHEEAESWTRFDLPSSLHEHAIDVERDLVALLTM